MIVLKVLMSINSGCSRDTESTSTMTPYLDQSNMQISNAAERRSSIFSGWAEDALRRNSVRKMATSFQENPEEGTAVTSSDKARRQSSFSTGPLIIASTIVFVDLEGYSKTSDMHQKYITKDFMSTLRELLTVAYGSVPDRSKVDDYVILPTGDGAAVCVMQPPQNTSCPSCDSHSLQDTEETALWIGASLLLWASRRNVGLRVGLNSGDLTIVEDPYGDANVCGDAINLASRIMDTATPGQILASSDTVVPKLNGSKMNRSCDCQHCPHLQYDIATEPSEIVVKHDVTTHVQSIVCTLNERRSTDLLDIRSSIKDRARSYQEDELFEPDLSLVDWREISFETLSSSYTTKPYRQHTSLQTSLSTSLTLPSKQPAHLSHSVGSHDAPKTKWYMKIKPTEMLEDAKNIRPKILPQELIRRHKRIAFVGITHDNLCNVFQEALNDDPTHTWDQVSECTHLSISY